MVKFGVALISMSPQDICRGNYEILKKVAVEAEKLGFDSFWLNDHLFTFPQSPTPFLECWTTLSALASETKEIRLGTLATCASFRWPSLLAKMASTLDVISGGRLELGIGAGWYEAEYKAYGIPFPPTETRIKKLEETVRILKDMWTKEKTTFHGKYYHLENAICSPKPVQKPHPPIWICGGGEKLTLRVVAKYGDGCNFSDVTSEEYERKLNVLKKHCLKVGRNIETIQKSIASCVFIADSKQEAKRTALRVKIATPLRTVQEMSFEDFVEPHIFGTPKLCIRKIKQYMNVGVEYFMLCFPCSDILRSLSLFAEKVMSFFQRT